MTTETFKEVLRLHKLWLDGEDGGKRANLSNSDLRGSDLRGSDLRDSDLRGSDLRDSDLRGSNLGGSKNNNLAKAMTSICPEGELVGWKKLREEIIVRLIIPKEAKRSNATGRKCRAEFAIVDKIFKGSKEVTHGISQHDNNFTYEIGKTVLPDKWDENRWNECSNGIHFFITREEAEAYEY